MLRSNYDSVFGTRDRPNEPGSGGTVVALRDSDLARGGGRENANEVVGVGRLDSKRPENGLPNEKNFREL